MKKSLSLILWVVAAFILCSCKKDPEVNMSRFEITQEKVLADAINVKITGTFSFPGKIDGMLLKIGREESLLDADCHDIQISDKNFLVSVDGLIPGTKYYYCYSVDYGASKDWVTETEDFTTLAQAPAVETIEVLPIDTTTVRVKCKAVSDGGVAITERGICWNTYGDPTLDDETMTNGEGLGEYSCFLSDLEMSTTYFVRAYAKNETGVGFGEIFEFKTAAPVVLPSVSTVEITNVTATSAVCVGNVSSDGGAEVFERGACWSTSQNPTVSGNHANSGTGTGSYTIAMSGLSANTTYHVRTYAINSKGVSYGEDKTFQTTIGLPSVTTSSVTEITSVSAKCGGNVTDQGASNVTERGICWSTSHDPTTSGNHANSGTGTGSFTVQMTGLTANTTYYVRAYAKNSQGIAYGDEVSFTTSQNISAPTVTTSQVTNITQTTATGGGNVTSDGGANVTERGICWSTSHSPTTSGNHANSGTGTGSFSVQMTGLTPGTTYYVRAYATNSASTAYGSEVSFTTQSGGGSGTLTFTANGVSFEMIEVEGGTFWMGAQSTNPSGQNYDSEASDWEQPVHQVTLSSYHIGKFEVTQQLWQAVMGSNPSWFSGSNLPVEQVSWNDCQNFIAALNELCASQLNGKHFSLPTEAQWEFAARGGNQSHGYKYSGSNILGNVAWYDDNSGNTTHAVGTKQANELGLYDMSGNVEEWCSDWYGSYSSSAQTDPTGPASGSYRVYRGGSWNFHAWYCRVSYRHSCTPDNSSGNLGLRLSLR